MPVMLMREIARNIIYAILSGLVAVRFTAAFDMMYNYLHNIYTAYTAAIICDPVDILNVITCSRSTFHTLFLSCVTASAACLSASVTA